jgi:hypothetical protein
MLELQILGVDCGINKTNSCCGKAPRVLRRGRGYLALLDGQSDSKAPIFYYYREKTGVRNKSKFIIEDYKINNLVNNNE